MLETEEGNILKCKATEGYRPFYTLVAQHWIYYQPISRVWSKRLVLRQKLSTELPHSGFHYFIT